MNAFKYLCREKIQMILIYTKFKGYTRRLELTFLFASIFTIVTLVSLNQITIIENANATSVTGNTTTITSEPPIIIAQPPVNEKTGQIIVPPTKILIEKDPITGKTEVSNVLTKDPIVDSGKTQKTPESNDQNLNFGLNLEDFHDGLTLDNSRSHELINNALFLNLNNDDSRTISSILNNTSEVIDWFPFESIIAVKVKNELDHKPVFIGVHAFMNNKDQIIAEWVEEDFNLYKFVHFSSSKWESPAVSIDVKLPPPVNFTKSSMCNTYLEMGKLYKCNITIK
jgi:hypothetical protein